MVGLVAPPDYCSVCEDYKEDLLICDKCNDYVCDDCVEELNGGLFCSVDCLSQH